MKVIRVNPSFSNSLVESHTVEFMNMMNNTFPNYDYTEFERVLSSLRLKEGTVDGYAQYNGRENALTIDKREIYADGIDLQHLFFQQLLAMSTHKEEIAMIRDTKPNGIEELYKGINKMMVSALLVPDEGRKKTDVLQYHFASILSKIVEPEILVHSYMKNDLRPIVLRLREMDITLYDFQRLVGFIGESVDPSVEDNESFRYGQELLMDMYRKKLQKQIMMGEVDPKHMHNKIGEFASNLIRGKYDLLAIYPQNDFSKLRLDDKDVSKSIKESRTLLETYLVREGKIPWPRPKSQYPNDVMPVYYPTQEAFEEAARKVR